MNETDRNRIKYFGGLQRLKLGPDDIIVLTASEELSDSERAYIIKSLEGITDHRIIVLDAGIKIGILSPT